MNTDITLYQNKTNRYGVMLIRRSMLWTDKFQSKCMHFFRINLFEYIIVILSLRYIHQCWVVLRGNFIIKHTTLTCIVNRWQELVNAWYVYSVECMITMLSILSIASWFMCLFVALHKLFWEAMFHDVMYRFANLLSTRLLMMICSGKHCTLSPKYNLLQAISCYILPCCGENWLC